MEQLLEGVVAILCVSMFINFLVGICLIINLGHIVEVLGKLLKTYKKVNNEKKD